MDVIPATLAALGWSSQTTAVQLRPYKKMINAVRRLAHSSIVRRFHNTYLLHLPNIDALARKKPNRVQQPELYKKTKALHVRAAATACTAACSRRCTPTPLL